MTKNELKLSVIIFIFLLITSRWANQVEANDNIPIKGAVYAVYRSDGSPKTYIDLSIGRHFTGTLPDDIDSILVSGPDNKFQLNKSDFKYNPMWRSFWCVRSGLPKTGTYIFKVSQGDKKGQTKNTLSIIKKIPLPDTSRFTPARGNTIDCLPPVFSWQLLKNDNPLFYQVEIRDAHRKHVYKTRYVRDMSSVRLPPDILNPHSGYQWRLRVADGEVWGSFNNRSQSRWVPFFTNADLDICTYTYHPPEFVKGSWKVSSLDKQEVGPQKIQEMMHQVLGNNLKKIHSILLIKNGSLVLEEYFGGYHRNLKHSVQSVTKSVTSILLGIAKDRGEKILLNGNLTTYLPEYKDLLFNKPKGQITLEHLLTMTAGFEWNELHAPTDLKHMIWSNDAIKYVLERKLVDPPGKRFHYGTGLSTILGRILKNTTGSNAVNYADKYLFRPLGITDYSWGSVADGSISTGAALYLRPRDMAKLGYLFLNNGTWKGRQIVSNTWVKKSIYPHVKGDLISGTGYGYQWWSGSTRVGDRDIDAFYAAGHGGQMIVQVPSLDTIFVITSEYDDNNAGDFRACSILQNYVIPAVLGHKPVGETPPFQADNYKRITGKYRWPKAKLDLKIFIENGKLYGDTFIFDGKFEMFPVKKDRFMCVSKDVGKFFIDVTEDSKGNIKRLKAIFGFSNLPFQKKRRLFWGI